MIFSFYSCGFIYVAALQTAYAVISGLRAFRACCTQLGAWGGLTALFMSICAKSLMQ
jgi:hypothetical protein